MDGIATGQGLVATTAWLAIALIPGGQAGNLTTFTAAVLAAALFGGLLAFLFFNWAPAKVFMGDGGQRFPRLQIRRPTNPGCRPRSSRRLAQAQPRRPRPLPLSLRRRLHPAPQSLRHPKGRQPPFAVRKRPSRSAISHFRFSITSSPRRANPSPPLPPLPALDPSRGQPPQSRRRLHRLGCPRSRRRPPRPLPKPQPPARLSHRPHPRRSPASPLPPLPEVKNSTTSLRPPLDP